MINDQPGMVFRYSFLLLMCLSTLTLTYAEGFLVPQFLGLPIILISFTLVDRMQKFSINSTVAAFLGFLAIIAGFVEFMSGNEESRILSASHLVSYLLWITLLQQKDPRQYWWLIALSVMQMAVASVLTSEFMFGMGILCYLFLIIWTLAFFSVYRATLRIKSAANHVQSVPDPIALKNNQTDVERKTVLKLPRSTVRGSIHLNPGEPWISWQFFGGVLAITLLSLFVAGVFFVFTPRLWIGNIHFPSDTPDGSSSITGFTESVRLGEMGSIMENPARVFTAKIFRLNGEDPVSDEEFCNEYGVDEILFRGSVMTRYSPSGSNSVWRNTSRLNMAGRLVRRPFEELYRVEIIQKSITGNYLFSLGFFGNVIEDISIDGITHEQASDSLLASTRFEQEYKFTVYKTSIRDHHLCLPISRDVYEEYRNTEYLYKCARLPVENPLLQIKEFTDKLVLDEQTRLKRQLSDREIAFFLEKYLQSSPEYSYSLNQTIKNPELDPVEDFLIHRKSGHCEYFASALALMLRSQNIPTRLISGFKGGTYNEGTRSIDVKQLHAHSWLEYFDYDEFMWITLDPTPAAPRETQIAQLEETFKSNESMISKLSGLWNSNIVNMNLEQQQQTLYTPLYEMLKTSWENLKGVRNFVAIYWDVTVDIFSDPRKLFSLRGFILVSIFGLIAVLIWFLTNRIIPSISKRLLKKSLNHSSHIRVPFYERYLQFVRKLNLYRQPEQTPLELTYQVQQVLTAKTIPHAESSLIDDLTKAYYHIRFGHYDLPEQDHQLWLAKIDLLEQHLQQEPQDTNNRS